MFAAAEEYGIEIEPDPERVERLLSITPADVEPADRLTFARNVFVPLTTACRYTCTYCTYYDVPGEASLLSPEEVRQRCRVGADAGCTEALFTFGDEPDDRYTAVHDQLDEWGYDSILEYLYRACEIALEEGLLPHSNPGDLTEAAFADLREVNASMGVMLETTADVDAHSGGRRKTPGQRLNTIRAAGRQGVPFTTGILLGIGEDWRDRAESLLAIREIHERHGHVQEVIVQNVVPNERSDFEKPDLATMRRVVAMARAALPPKCRSKCRRTSRPRPTSSTAGSTTSAASPPSPTTTSTRTTRGPTSTASGRSPTRAGCRFASASRPTPDSSPTGSGPRTRSLPRLRPAATRGSRRRSATGCARTTRTGDGSVASRVATARSRSVGIECERARINNCAASSFFKY